MKEDASDYFEWRDMEDLYASMAWTIIEDAEALEGASLATTAQKFVEWVEGPEGRRDREGSVFDADDRPSGLRAAIYLLLACRRGEPGECRGRCEGEGGRGLFLQGREG